VPRWIFIVAITAAAAGDGHAGASRPERTQTVDTPLTILADGSAIARTGVQGETHRYDVALNEGDFLELSVSQDQLLAALSVHAPDGTRMHSIDVPDIDPLPQRLMFVAPHAARYSVDVTFVRSGRVHVEDPPPTDSRETPAGGRYVLHVVALRPATPADRERARWFALLERAADWERRGNREGLLQAVPLYQEAASGWRSLGDLPLEATTLEALAHLTGFFTEHNRESAAARERLAELLQRLGERWLEVHNLRSLGTEYLEGGRLENAKQVVTRALDLARAAGFRRSAAGSVHQLAIYEFELGNYDRARELALQAQELASGIPDHALEAMTLWDLGRLDALAGDLDAAIARNTRALEVAAGSVPATSRITMWLGFYHLQRGDLEKAASYFEARLGLAKRTVQRDQEALTRLGLGDVLLARGDRSGALQRYEDAAAALARGAQPWRCMAEQRLARMDLEDGRLDQAGARFETMRGIAAAMQHAECEAEARAGLADLAARRGDLDAADPEARRVVELMEEFREATGSPESRSLGFGALAPAYERAIDIAMRRAERGDAGAMASALTLNEQALARGLLDQVSENRLDSRARVPGSLAGDYRRLRQQRRARLAELQVAIRVRPRAVETRALIEETRVLGAQLHDLQARIDAADPRPGNFLRPQPLGVEAIQALLDDDTVLLEYALGDQRSYLWVVSAREVRAFTLAPRGAIESLARRVHEQLSRSPVEAARPGSPVRDEPGDLRTLSRLIVEPAASLLAAARLVVVLPGALSLVPFGALPSPGDGRDPLIARHEIVQVPSMTTLRAMRGLTAGRPRANKMAVIFADPVFDRQDPRVRRASARGLRQPTSPARDPSRSAARFAGLSLTRLPFSQGEAREIASLVPASMTVFLGLDATRERAVDPGLSDYRLIHFATHGIVNQDVPNLSSIVLSLVDRQGRPRDGFVMLPDVYDMTLNADLVVLSGCQTALGRQVRGEGPVGLARAFMFAGVPRVVASLWKVDDLATAELMKRFYRGVLTDGLTPAAALRAAQRELAGDRRWRSPYFWAPFVLQGDWR
jgi:CHAT domain-containing protein